MLGASNAANASPTALKRIQKELQSIESDTESGFKITVVNGNICHWKTSLTGPADTPYEGGVFGIEGNIQTWYCSSVRLCLSALTLSHVSVSDM
jgi:ubiquitin-protein ligase